MKKRHFAVLLCLIMCLSLIPVTAWAEEDAPVEMAECVEAEAPAAMEECVEAEAPAVLEDPMPEEQLDGTGFGPEIEIDDTNFPDDAFRAYVSDELDSDESGTLSEAEIAEVTGIYVNNKGIWSLQGIEFFTALEVLDCNQNALDSLDVSKNTALTWLDCGSNQLTALDVSQNTALTELYCGINQLTALDVSQNTALTVLDCKVNPLGELDVSANTGLTCLNCNQNELEILNVSQNTALTELSFAVNSISSVDLSSNTALTQLICAENGLTELDLSANTALTYLECTGNILTELDVSANTDLTELYCAENALDELDLSANTNLLVIECAANALTKLDVSGCTQMDTLWCAMNQLTGLDLSANTALLDLECSFNQLTELDLSMNTALKYLFCTDNDLTELDIRSTQSCLPEEDSEVHHGYFGNQAGGSVTVFMTAAQKAFFDANFAENDMNTGVLAVVEPARELTVTFNMNGHGAQIAAQTVKEGNKATRPTDPTERGYTFQDWYVDPACSTVFDFNSPITDNTTVYAKWTKNSVPSAPSTGDTGHAALWLALSCAFATGAAIVLKKKQRIG